MERLGKESWEEPRGRQNPGLTRCRKACDRAACGELVFRIRTNPCLIMGVSAALVIHPLAQGP
jgi:hypothetical protein